MRLPVSPPGWLLAIQMVLVAVFSGGVGPEYYPAGRIDTARTGGPAARFRHRRACLICPDGRSFPRRLARPPVSGMSPLLDPNAERLNCVRAIGPDARHHRPVGFRTPRDQKAGDRRLDEVLR